MPEDREKISSGPDEEPVVVSTRPELALEYAGRIVERVEDARADRVAGSEPVADAPERKRRWRR